MSAEKDQLQTEIHAAMKAGEKVRVGALRLLSASVKNREVELGHELSAEEFTEIAVREAKRRKESIEAYEGAGRTELVERERAELAVLEPYLPEALSEDELGSIIEAAVASTGASGPGDLGAVMKAVMVQTRGRADGKAVSEAVRARLSGA
ncbi:MAG: GatB/YqeY domain-containing protein [Actinomycetota bacterium]